MVIVSSRRDMLATVTSTAIAWAMDDVSSSSNTSTGSLSTIICNYTPKAFRLAVAATGCFLYRGESSATGMIPNNQPSILDPQPDLLVPGTYDDPAALHYFQCLEKRLKRSKFKTVALPSTGHIATSNVAEAAQWGEAVSVWPLGDSFSYVWPRQETVFFPSTTKCPVNDDLGIDQDLNIALQGGHEVLFTSAFQQNNGIRPAFLSGSRKSAFLAVPMTFEKALHEIAQQPEFTS